ncbi:hypothetical protein T265_12152 [Opisthorchis viverrini]|uniref:Reverse transcriptase domain-containing protein n=1 Tax=Opisthorchis viverrini TaxID=6198 RepID=A0A074YVJ9_OPIVI|nr:hypothetical protein T265_12152 [Opisthorchis viverrini]KER18796.1 hypothetical protein T265_12152 [Opisthorchis viverrini]
MEGFVVCSSSESIDSVFPGSTCLFPLNVARQALIREQQAGFLPGRCCTDQIFALPQVYPSVLHNKLSWQGCSQTFKIATLFAELRKGFHTQGVIRHGYPLSPSSFLFVLDESIRGTLKSLQSPHIRVAADKILHLEYADDVVFCSTLVVFLDGPKKLIQSFGTRFAPLKCKVIILDMLSPTIIIIIIINDSTDASLPYNHKPYTEEKRKRVGEGEDLVLAYVKHTECKISVLKYEEVAGSDGLYLSLFKEDVERVVTHLTKPIGATWNEQKVHAE